MTNPFAASCPLTKHYWEHLLQKLKLSTLSTWCLKDLLWTSSGKMLSSKQGKLDELSHRLPMKTQGRLLVPALDSLLLHSVSGSENSQQRLMLLNQ